VKIAIATEGNMVSGHFGHCEVFTVFEVDENQNKILKKEIIKNPEHQPGFLPGYLAQFGINCIIAGGMGARAKELFEEYDIMTVTGISGQVDEVIQEFLKGNIIDKGSICNHGEGHHGGHCSH